MKYISLQFILILKKCEFRTELKRESEIVTLTISDFSTRGSLVVDDRRPPDVPYQLLGSRLELVVVLGNLIAWQQVEVDHHGTSDPIETPEGLSSLPRQVGAAPGHRALEIREVARGDVAENLLKPHARHFTIVADLGDDRGCSLDGIAAGQIHCNPLGLEDRHWRERLGTVAGPDMVGKFGRIREFNRLVDGHENLTDNLENHCSVLLKGLTICYRALYSLIVPPSLQATIS